MQTHDDTADDYCHFCYTQQCAGCTCSKRHQPNGFHKPCKCEHGWDDMHSKPEPPPRKDK